MTDRTCEVAGCDAPHLADGLCQRHYSQRRRGRLAPDAPQVGDPSGFGRWGVLDRDEESVLCHECGRRLGSLGYHLRRVHDMTVPEYQDAHGLARTVGLVSLGVARRLSERALDQVGGAGWQRLEAARDPVAASGARDEGAMRSPAALRQAARKGRALSVRQRGTGVVRECSVCGAPHQGRGVTCGRDACLTEVRSRRSRASTSARYVAASDEQASELRRATGDALGVVVRRLQSEGVSSASIARALGRSRAWVSEHFPRP